MTATVQFREAPEGYRVSFHYSRGLVDMIKTTVPPSARRWVPQHKHWVVAESWAPELAEVLRDAGCKVIGLQVQNAYTEWAVSLFQAVGEDRAPAVHRALSSVLHPDRPTGSAELQQQLNDGRRQVELRQADMPNLLPNEPAAAFSQKFGVPLAEVVKASESRSLMNALVQRYCETRDGRLVRREVKSDLEHRGMSGFAARRELERIKEPGSTLGDPDFRRPSRSGIDALRITLRYMRPGSLAPKRRSGRQALLAVLAEWRPEYGRWW
jgi:hypothetical protein